MNYYVKVGNHVTVTEEKPHEGFAHRVIAKKMDGESPKYYIALANSFVLNPRELSDREMKSQHNGFKQVGPDIFNKYLDYATNPSKNISFKIIERLCQ